MSETKTINVNLGWFPYVLLWGVSVLAFGLLTPNFFINSTSSKCKKISTFSIFRWPNPDDPDCPTVSWGQWAAHLGIFALLLAFFLIVFWKNQGGKILSLLKEIFDEGTKHALGTANYLGGKLKSTTQQLVCPTTPMSISAGSEKSVEMTPVNFTVGEV
jgi:hypothetical protein